MQRGCIDDEQEIGVSLVALAECAHVLRTQYDVGQRDIIDSLIGLIQRENIRVLGQRSRCPRRACSSALEPCRVGRFRTP